MASGARSTETAGEEGEGSRGLAIELPGRPLFQTKPVRWCHKRDRWRISEVPLVQIETQKDINKSVLFGLEDGLSRMRIQEDEGSSKGGFRDMKITPGLFEAYLKCPTKCWLRATGERSAGNIYSEWVKEQNDSYR
jgi:hypothetical protein